MHNAQALWINLREEPVIYINDRPFVLRRLSSPFSNLEYTGINEERLEEMENRMREDVLMEAKNMSGRVLLHDEAADGSMFTLTEEVSEDTVLTPRMVYENLIKRGYKVTYKRLPITDEQAPEESDFEMLIEFLKTTDEATHVVFNCQMGRGRTTTGLIVTCLFRTRLMSFDVGLPAIIKSESIAQLEMEDIQYHKGEYKIIRRLVRVLDNGIENKEHVDHFIDRCSILQNLREAVEGNKIRAEELGDSNKKLAVLERGIHYLKRYFLLIAFNAYLRACPEFAPPFGEWMKQRSELYSLLRNIQLE